jgi:hypothetical protein
MPHMSLKQCYFAEFSNCSTKPLSKLLTSILSTIKTWFQCYFDTDTSCYKGGLNQMSILANSRDIVENINQVCGSSRPAILNRIAKFDNGWGLSLMDREPSWSWSYHSWTTGAISAYYHWSCEFDSCSWRGVLDTSLCDNVCKWRTVVFSGTLVYCTNKTDLNDIAEILLKVALNTLTLISAL